MVKEQFIEMGLWGPACRGKAAAVLTGGFSGAFPHGLLLMPCKRCRPSTLLCFGLQAYYKGKSAISPIREFYKVYKNHCGFSAAHQQLFQGLFQIGHREQIHIKLIV